MGISVDDHGNRCPSAVIGRRSRDDIAGELTRQLGRKVTVANVATLVEAKLQPLGILAQSDGSSPAASKADRCWPPSSAPRSSA